MKRADYLFNISNQVEERWVVGRLFLNREKTQKALQHAKTNVHMYILFSGWSMFHNVTVL